MLQSAALHLNDGETIQIWIGATDTTTLLECKNPVPFLAHITQGRWTGALDPDTYLRGVLFDDEEAIFTLCDQFGVVADEVVRLSPEAARALILEKVW
jgi:hypothetical protein